MTEHDEEFRFSLSDPTWFENQGGGFGTFVSKPCWRTAITPIELSVGVRLSDFRDFCPENEFRVVFTSEIEFVPHTLARRAPISFMAVSVTAAFATSSVLVQPLRPGRDGLIAHQPISVGFYGDHATSVAAIGQHWPQRTHMPRNYVQGVAVSGTFAVQHYLADFGLPASAGALSNIAGTPYLGSYEKVEKRAFAFLEQALKKGL